MRRAAGCCQSKGCTPGSQKRTKTSLSYLIEVLGVRAWPPRLGQWARGTQRGYSHWMLQNVRACRETARSSGKVINEAEYPGLFPCDNWNSDVCSGFFWVVISTPNTVSKPSCLQSLQDDHEFQNILSSMKKSIVNYSLIAEIWVV